MQLLFSSHSQYKHTFLSTSPVPCLSTPPFKIDKGVARVGGGGGGGVSA
jgi:hypothetical protein